MDLKEKGNEAFKLKKYKEAINHYSKALDSLDGSLDNHSYAIVYSNRSVCYRLNGKFKEALKDAESSIKSSPKWYKGYYRKAEVLVEMNQYEEAHESLVEAFYLVGVEASASQLQSIKNLLYYVESIDPSVYFKVLHPGKDYCAGFTINPITILINRYAKQFRNQIYIVGDVSTRECVVVDPCWDVSSILNIIQKDKMKLVGIVVTHYHFDHVGGVPPPPFEKFTVPGVRSLQTSYPDLKIYVNDHELEMLPLKGNVVACKDLDVVRFGSTELQFLHTPGHTAGSQCILVNKTRLLTGDTLFCNSCGRCDLPGGDSQVLKSTLGKLSQMNERIVCFPGHDYNGKWTTISHEKNLGILSNKQ